MESRHSASMATDRQNSPETTSCIDRLSDLPDSVICHILSFLPTKNVVATSVVSTRWKSLWKKGASLEFRFRDIYAQNFDQIVNKVLLVGDAGQLDKFRLQWDSGSKKEADYVDIWVNHVITRNLRSLDLEFGNSFDVDIPETLFTCETLESLKLIGVLTLQVPNVVCLPNLKTLHLEILFRNISNESIHKLVAGCPALHTLTIVRDSSYSDADLKISSPSLRYLSYDSSKDAKKKVYDRKLEIDAPNLECLSLLDSSSDCSIKGPIASVDTVSLDLGMNCFANSFDDVVAFRENIYNNRRNSTVKLVEALNRAKRLTLMGMVMTAINFNTVPLSTRFERLTRLDIVSPWCHCRSLHLVLGCCIRLRFLSMSEDCVPADISVKKTMTYWKDPEKVPECLSSSLAHVSLKTFNGLESEMSMVGYFLKHGSVLESFNIVTAHSSITMADDKLQMLQSISKFPRLSTTCSVEFV